MIIYSDIIPLRAFKAHYYIGSRPLEKGKVVSPAYAKFMNNDDALLVRTGGFKTIS